MASNIKIGSKVRLTEDIETDKIHKAGEIFTVYDQSYRGWDLVNDKGETIDETRFTFHKYELYDIKEERKEKLQKINDKKS